MKDSRMVVRRRERKTPSSSSSAPSFSMLPIVLTIALGGCATTGPAGRGDDAQNDPLEPFNRNVFAINTAIDHAVIRPIASAYRDVLPEGVRNHIRTILDNMHEPLVFLNNVLQGRGEAAGVSYNRFIINTTLGLGGFNDRAADFGFVRQSGDFGQTLYAWGVEDGPYIVLPLFGPSNFRDAIGLGVDAYASPVGHIGSELTRRQVSLSSGIVDGTDLRSRNIEALDSIEATSLDFYAYLRSASRQNRQATLRDARDDSPTDELLDPGAGPAATPGTPETPETPGTPRSTKPLPR